MLLSSLLTMTGFDFETEFGSQAGFSSTYNNEEFSSEFLNTYPEPEDKNNELIKQLMQEVQSLKASLATVPQTHREQASQGQATPASTTLPLLGKSTSSPAAGTRSDGDNGRPARKGPTIASSEARATGPAALPSQSRLSPYQILQNTRDDIKKLEQSFNSHCSQHDSQTLQDLNERLDGVEAEVSKIYKMAMTLWGVIKEANRKEQEDARAWGMEPSTTIIGTTGIPDFDNGDQRMST